MNLIYYGPMLMLFNGFWVMDNLQIFDNVSNSKDSSSDHMKSGHTIELRIAQSSPMLYVCLIAIAVMSLRWVIPYGYFIEKGFTMTPNIKEIDE